jgi:hypothetical protein
MDLIAVELAMLLSFHIRLARHLRDVPLFINTVTIAHHPLFIMIVRGANISHGLSLRNRCSLGHRPRSPFDESTSLAGRILYGYVTGANIGLCRLGNGS